MCHFAKPGTNHSSKSLRVQNESGRKIGIWVGYVEPNGTVIYNNGFGMTPSEKSVTVRAAAPPAKLVVLYARTNDDSGSIIEFGPVYVPNDNSGFTWSVG
jgi:hypothetical protein